MKRFFRLIAALILCSLLAACGAKPEPSASTPAQTEAPTTAPTTAPTQAPTAAPTEAPAGPEDLLAWGGKTLSGYPTKWAKQQGFAVADAAATDEEDADCASYSASYSFALANSAEKYSGMTVNISIYLGKDTSVLFDIPEEEEIDPLTEGFLAEQIKALLPEAKEETKTLGNTVWNVRSFCQQAQADGYIVYDLIAWSEADSVLAYVNASAVLRGTGLSEKDAETVTGLLQEWFSSLEIR